MEKIVTLLLMPAMEILVPMMLNVTWWKLEDFRKYSGVQGNLLKKGIDNLVKTCLFYTCTRPDDNTP